MFLRCLWGSKNYADPTNDFRLEESGFHSEPTFMDDQQLRCAHFHGDASCDILFFFLMQKGLTLDFVSHKPIRNGQLCIGVDNPGAQFGRFGSV